MQASVSLGQQVMVVVSMVLSVFVTGFGDETFGDDWPNWRGPDHNGISNETGWTTNWPGGTPKILWRASVGQGFSSFTVVGDRVYTMGHADGNDTVYCLKAGTGEVVWKRSYRCPPVQYPGPRATPTVDGAYLYTFSQAGDLNCFKADTGTVIWSRKVPASPPQWGFASSPFIYGNLVIVNAGTSGMAFNKGTGRPVWSGGNGKAGYASVVPYKRGSRTMLLVFSSRALFGVSPANGRRLWSFDWVTNYDVNAADPLVVGGGVFISSGYGVGCAMLSLARGAPRVVWRNHDMKNHYNSTVRWKDALYGFDDAVLRCLDLKTGRSQWAQPGLGKGALMIADGKLIILSERGELVIAEASPDSYKVLARGQAVRGHCWTTPILANGRIYCRTDRGDVACVDVGGKESSSEGTDRPRSETPESAGSVGRRPTP